MNRIIYSKDVSIDEYMNKTHINVLHYRDKIYQIDPDAQIEVYETKPHGEQLRIIMVIHSTKTLKELLTD